MKMVTWLIGCPPKEPGIQRNTASCQVAGTSVGEAWLEEAGRVLVSGVKGRCGRNIMTVGRTRSTSPVKTAAIPAFGIWPRLSRPNSHSWELVIFINSSTQCFSDCVSMTPGLYVPAGLPETKKFVNQCPAKIKHEPVHVHAAPKRVVIMLHKCVPCQITPTKYGLIVILTVLGVGLFLYLENNGMQKQEVGITSLQTAILGGRE